MAKVKSYTSLLVIALVLPLAGANFIMMMTSLTLQKVFEVSSMSLTAEYISLYLPLVLFLVGLAFSILALVGSKKDPKVLPVTALVLNAIFVVITTLNIVFTLLLDK